MIEVREELNELSSDTFQYVSFTLDLHGKRMVSVFKNHQFVNDLDLDTVSLKISQIISFALIKNCFETTYFPSPAIRLHVLWIYFVKYTPTKKSPKILNS